MPPFDSRVLDNAGRLIEDAFVTVADDAALPNSGSLLVTLARLLAEPALLDRPLRWGAALPVGGGLDPILPLLGRLALIALPFPLFRDGRGFSHARALREEHGFAGDIRATGHVLPDQYVFLLRVGFSSVALNDGADAEVWAASLRRQSHPETPAAERALPLLRRVAMPFSVG